MSSVEVTMENEADVLRLFQMLPRDIFEEVQNILHDGARRVAERAREIVPVRTGRLRDSIMVEGGIEADVDEAFQPIAVVATAPYASFVEDGTSKMTPRPFLEPALEEIEPEVMAEVDDVLEMRGFTKTGAVSEEEP